MPEDLATQWDSVRRALRSEASELTYHVWLAPLDLAGRRGGTLFVRASARARPWVSERYGPFVAKVASRVLGQPVRVEVVDERWSAPEEPEQAGFAARLQPAGEELLNPKYTFEQFVIGVGNRLAHAAALAVSEMPSQAYNPLFLHGSPGLGKTHLLHAIGNYLQLHEAGLTVRYSTVESFTSGFVSALRGENMAAFKDAFRSTDVLLIDDVQYLAGKERTKEEFFHTFNALFESGRQLVITSDRAPGEMADVETRLLERFGSGLVAALEPPDHTVRLAILRKRARLDAIGGVDDDTLQEIARHRSASVRTLEGALIRVVALASLRGEPATPELAREVLERLYPRATTGPRSLHDVYAATAEHFGVRVAELAAHDRRPGPTRARQVAMYLARELTEESLPSIGRSLGGRNHSTVLNAHRRITALLGAGGTEAARVETLRKRLVGEP
jgi:chromosomal replication initiator protein